VRPTTDHTQTSSVAANSLLLCCFRTPLLINEPDCVPIPHALSASQCLALRAVSSAVGGSGAAGGSESVESGGGESGGSGAVVS
jgi:uncharacterized membrane protein YgcG